MAPANGATGRPGQSTSRRPAGGAYKPVVPVIPLQLIRPPRHNLSVPVSSQPPVNTHPARNETAAEPDSPEAEAIRAEAKLDEAEQTTADRQHTTPPASEPQFRPEPSAPEVVTASAPPTTTVTTANDRLATPPSERSSRRDRGTVRSRLSCNTLLTHMLFRHTNRSEFRYVLPAASSISDTYSAPCRCSVSYFQRLSTTAPHPAGPRSLSRHGCEPQQHILHERFGTSSDTS